MPEISRITEDQTTNEGSAGDPMMLKDLSAMMEHLRNAPKLHELPVEHWEGFLGGPMPSPALHSQEWPEVLAAVRQQEEIVDLPVDLAIRAVWDEDTKAQDDVIGMFERAFVAGRRQFFKVGFRTTKDTFCVTAKDARETFGILSQSERAFEEIAMAKARGWDAIPVTFRDEIASPSIDRTELRVLIRNHLIYRVSTGPYTRHTEAMALQLLRDAIPTLDLIAAELHVDEAICDVFKHDGAWWLCDMNPVLPTTWPGHFAYMGAQETAITLAFDQPHAEGNRNVGLVGIGDLIGGSDA